MKRKKQSFYTPTGLAVLCGVSSPAIIRACVRGDIKATQTPGGHYRIPPDIAKEFLKKLGYK
jgi:excisionase family DNA binding protein